jgi:hypothetical protein
LSSFSGVAKSIAVYGPQAIKFGRKLGKSLPGISEAMGDIDNAVDIAQSVANWASPTGAANPPPSGGAAQSGGAGFTSADRTELQDCHLLATEAVEASQAAWATVGDQSDVNTGSIMSYMKDTQNLSRLTQEILSLYSTDICRYSLDATGLAAYRADKASGLVTGEGMIVTFHRFTGTDTLLMPVLNPEMLVIEAASGAWAEPTLPVIADMLAGLSPRPPHV